MLMTLIVKTWTIQNESGVNANKIELIMFTRRHKIPDFRKPKLDGTMLEVKPQAKYLSIILDRELNWTSNIEERKKKAFVVWCTCHA
uniref:Uncharacterized protein n=1 Tax=Megaselia scalaris TaxID=36166 RepID=T1GUY1_MEGSC